MTDDNLKTEMTMKKIMMMTLTALLVISLSACAQTNKTKENKEMKTLVACADLKATYPAVHWKEGRLLNRASKKELESWINELH